MLICEICNNEAHHVHHKDENRKNNKPENLQDLCTLCHAKIHNISPKFCELKRLVVMHNRIQKARMALANQIMAFLRIELVVPESMNEALQSFKDNEKKLEKQIKYYLEGRKKGERKNKAKPPFETYLWLREIPGISHLLAGKLISYIDIDNTPSVSSLRQYAGYGQPQRKKKGQKAAWNHELKKYFYQIADSFIKQGRNHYYVSKYYRPYKAKEFWRLRAGIEGFATCRGHVHARAIRYMIKTFIKDLYIEMKRCNVHQQAETHHERDKQRC